KGRSQKSDGRGPCRTVFSRFPTSVPASPGAASRARGVEKVLHPGEEPARLRVVVLGGDLLKLLEQLALAARQVLRRFDRDLDVGVAVRRLAQHRHALAAQAELLAVLGAFGNLDPGLRAVERRHLERAAECGRRHRDRRLAEQVGAIALEQLVRPDRQEDVEVARRAAAIAGLALAGEPDAGAVLDAGRDVDRKRALLGDAALAGALGARVGDDLAAALALRAGALDREEALRGAHAPRAGAHGAGDGLGAGLRAGAGAIVARHGGRHMNLRRLAGEGLLQ